jgi:archaellum component FlaD/FlaE
MSAIFGSDDDEDEPEEQDPSGGMSGEPAEQVARDREPEFEDSPDVSTQDIQDLETRLDDVEANVEQTSASVRSIEETQETLSEEVEELNDRIRQLLGVYDQAAADANPFTDADGSNGFGIIDDPDDIEMDDPDGAEVDDQENPPAPTDDGVTGFDDLEARVEAERDQESAPSGDESTGEDTPEIPPAHANTSPTVSGDHQRLEEIPPTYAADIVVMQWLSMLVRRSGQAGALKSFEYYESVGWISKSVRQYLEAALSGPGIDAHVDPENPSEPDSDDHLESYTYITQLEELREVHGWDSA